MQALDNFGIWGRNWGYSPTFAFGRELGRLTNLLSVERVIAEYARIAYLDPASFFDTRGNLLLIAQMPEDARRVISGIEVTELCDGHGNERVHVGRLHKIRFASKIAALDSLGKQLGMFIDRIAGANGAEPIQVNIISYRDAQS